MSPPLSFFDDAEMNHLDEARRQVDAGSATVAYCVYENPFARSGGIYAVAVNYAATLQAHGRPAVVLSPFHSKLQSAPQEPLSCIATSDVPFGVGRVPIQIYEHRQGDTRWILFGADGYFDSSGGAGGSDPYVHDDPDKLLIDSLFASAAIPYVLEALGETNNLMVHVQDWELSATALTVKLAIVEHRLQKAAVVLTSHNPYDHGLPSTALALLTSRPFRGDHPIGTVYQCFMPLFDAPLTTVSQTFATDLTSDPLQTDYFADHLQPVFREQGVIGVNNGLFLSPKPPFSDSCVADAKAGRPDKILAEKDGLRKKMLVELEEYDDPRIQGRLVGHDGGPLRDLPPDIPVFMMFGRMDPGQKGFDVLARAIETMTPGKCRFVLTPIVPKRSDFSEDLRTLAVRRAGDVAVYPFRMGRGYLETMAGATFAVLPSLYEPFGAATEPYLMGTPVIGRATGGLCEQVADLDADREHATGLLFRETPPDGAAVRTDWRVIQRSERPIDRFRAPLYGAMVASLAATLARATELYKYDKVAYGRMLANLFDRAQSFSWNRAMDEYQKVYEMATR